MLVDFARVALQDTNCSPTSQYEVESVKMWMGSERNFTEMMRSFLDSENLCHFHKD